MKDQKLQERQRHVETVIGRKGIINIYAAFTWTAILLLAIIATNEETHRNSAIPIPFRPASRCFIRWLIAANFRRGFRRIQIPAALLSWGAGRLWLGHPLVSPVEAGQGHVRGTMESSVVYSPVEEILNTYSFTLA
jgi:hypothetical protein